MEPVSILAAIIPPSVLPSQAPSVYTNPLNTYQGNRQENGNGMLTRTALPEPASALAGLLITAVI